MKTKLLMKASKQVRSIAVAALMGAALLACGPLDLHAQATQPQVVRLVYSGTLLSYTCRAPQRSALSTFSTADSTLTNIADAANTATATFDSAHGLYPGARITVSSAVANLSGTYTVASTADTTTLTFTTASVADDTYTTGLTITTSFPLETAAAWLLTRYRYDGSDNLVSTYAAGNGAYMACADGGDF